MSKIKTILTFLPILALPAVSLALECSQVKHRLAEFTVCQVNADQDEIKLFHTDPRSNKPFGSFKNLQEFLAPQHIELQMAMNAGMYHHDLSPVGLFIENGQTQNHIVTLAGPGNFGMLPNGVFCIQKERATVIESRQFVQQQMICDFATQSGPMLVIDGMLHPRFLENSNSLFRRNGVGTSHNGQIIFFAISEQPINFYTFGTLFRDVLNVQQALYFDGKVSRLFAPMHNRNDLGPWMGPIVGVIKKVK
ncbi:MAG: phosphodiester glycosidase family protein [Aestuariivita sp.]|nr:phosphodiester glycosidase family protein [Aestuariivita sp.]